MARSVEMALERDPLLALFGQRGEAHHLIAAAVGQDRAAPAHEGVQPAQACHALGAWTQHQMIGVAQDDVRSEEHTSELQSLMRISYAVFCLKKKNITNASNLKQMKII